MAIQPLASLHGREAHRTLLLPLALSAVVLLLAGGGSALASTRTVTNLADDGPGTLREAIGMADPGDTIAFGVQGTISLTTGQLLVSRDLVINGPGEVNLAIDSARTSRLFEVTPGAVVTIRDLTMQRGGRSDTQGISGMAVLNAGDLTLERVTVQDCQAQEGPGAALFNQGTLRLRSCTVRRNAISMPGLGTGGIYSSGPLLEIERSTIAENGAFHSDYVSGAAGITVAAGHLLLSESAVTDNSIDGHAGGLQIKAGATAVVRRSLVARNLGVVFGPGGILNAGTLSMVGSTISGNESWDKAGGIANYGTLNAEFCTIVENEGSYGGVENGAGASFSASNTIIAGNLGSSGLNDFVGTLTSEGHNLVQDAPTMVVAGDETGNILGVDPLLGPLADNGGPTPTHAAGDPVVDRGNNTGAPDTDQRGLPRIVDGDLNGIAVADIGAFERQCHEAIDTDGDGVCDPEDLCPFAPDPGQVDGDGDGSGDACDCAPADPGAFAPAAEVRSLRLLAGNTGLEWDSGAAEAGSGIVYDVVRGPLDGLAPGAGPGFVCLVEGTPITNATDSADPAAGEGGYYLVRGRTQCGAGTYGHASDGTERILLACP